MCKNCSDKLNTRINVITWRLNCHRIWVRVEKVDVIWLWALVSDIRRPGYVIRMVATLSWRLIDTRPSTTTMLTWLNIARYRCHGSSYLLNKHCSRAIGRSATRWFLWCWRVRFLTVVTHYGVSEMGLLANLTVEISYFWLLSWGPISPMIFHRNSNQMKTMSFV